MTSGRLILYYSSSVPQLTWLSFRILVCFLGTAGQPDYWQGCWGWAHRARTKTKSHFKHQYAQLDSSMFRLFNNQWLAKWNQRNGQFCFRSEECLEKVLFTWVCFHLQITSSFSFFLITFINSKLSSVAELKFSWLTCIEVRIAETSYVGLQRFWRMSKQIPPSA